MAIVIPAIRHLTADEKDSLEEKSNQWNYPQLNNSNKERTKTGKLMEIIAPLTLVTLIALFGDFSPKKTLNCYEIGKPFECKNVATAVDTQDNLITYKIGGGWKDKTCYVTTRNDTVLSVKTIYPKF